MPAPDWVQKMLCIIVPNRWTVSPEFFSWVRTHYVIARIFPENDKFTASYQTMKYLPKALCISNVANNKNELWKLFWKTTIIIRFNLLHVCPSMPLLSEICCVFIPYISVSKLYFMSYSLWWRLSLFRATAPVSQCSFKFSAPWQKAQSLMKLPSFPPG